MEAVNFQYLSRDGKTNIHAMEWAPDGECRAVLQIAHGMVEFIARYDRFGKYLSSQGVCVVGNDHLGHGGSVYSQEDYGYFAEKDGNLCVIGDMHTLRERTQEKYPGIPYFLLGHSMGSFLARQYIEMHGEGLSGALIMGTGVQPAATLGLAKTMARIIGGTRGWHYRSKMLNNMALGSNNKKFEPARTRNDWLTKDEKIVDAYNANPWNNFVFTANAYYNLFLGLEYAQDRKNIRKIPKNLPIFILSGGDDPVGNFGRGPEQLKQIYQEEGLTDVRLKLYPGDRHEILNELDHDTVDRDVLAFLEENIHPAAQ